MKKVAVPAGETVRAVYLQACHSIATSVIQDGFQLRNDGPAALRLAGDFTHRIGFQSSHSNVAGERIALWIHATVSCARLRAWREQVGEEPVDHLAGGQIGNLDPVPRWRTWDLADAACRPDILADAVRTVRGVALPFFDLFHGAPTTLAALRTHDLLGLPPLAAIEFALAFGVPDLACAIVKRFFDGRPELRTEYDARVGDYRKDGVPTRWGGGYTKDLAKATVRYELDVAP